MMIAEATRVPNVKRFPVVEVRGSSRELGQQLGQQCRTQLQHSIDTIIGEVMANWQLPREQCLEKVRNFYIDFVEEFTPHLADELLGLAEGAGVTYEEAYLVQVRYEMIGYASFPKDEAAKAFQATSVGGPVPTEHVDGCTSFAIHGSRTFHEGVIMGQNVDTNQALEPGGVMYHVIPDDGRPRLLMYCSQAGMIGYLGMNSEGLGCVGNAVPCAGWRDGFPRYLAIRLGLEQKTTEDAIRVITDLPHRASSINLLFGDRHGTIRDLELAVDTYAVLEPKDGNQFMAHANHYLTSDLAQLSPPRPANAPFDSPIRQEQMDCQISELMSDPDRKIDVPAMQEVLRDHKNLPKAICRHTTEDANDPFRDGKSIASMVIEPTLGRMHVAVGNPCENPHHTYQV